MTQWIATIALSISLLVGMACTPNRRIVNSSAETPVPVNVAPAISSFEGDLEAMRNADFKFVLVFRRKDGAVLTAEDKAFANLNTPYNANRRRLADEGKAIIVGSNFAFPPGMPEKMTERFTMENYSKPDSGPIESNAVPNT